ncbi:MAG TPA: protein kinase, partial [Thermoanaerobaculia bacterium]|nr:protein kinase [Thermoanaerobaculia bacterium]
MTITSGTRLGPYEIVAPIGAGGMGEVYKARDTRLDRSVAVKILPAEFAANTQLKIRFEREAKTISQLSHPNICTLYDVGENYLVMELLDGETLADRLTRGALPLADVFKFGTQIAEALGKAHREGVIHRDLKPGNIMITKTGAKLLDFGLAKSKRVQESDKTITQEGTILGTIQYMAPEQLAGEEPDARTDIFAFGAVLYEMVTGKRAFDGKTRTSIVSAIIAAEPPPIGEIQPLTPPALDHVVRKCMAKDRDDRWQNALDIAEELRWIAEERPAKSIRRTVWPMLGVAVLLALVIGALIGAWSVARQRTPAAVVYTTVEPPEGASFAFDAASAALSPNGEMIAMVAKSNDGLAIWIRRLDSPAASMLRGTDNPSFPFWSPDSKQVGFFADGKLKKIEVNSGAVETIADAATGRGGSWSADGTILFAPTPGSAIFAVAATGGVVRQVTHLDTEAGGGTSHRFPAFLPDGRHFLYYVQGASEHNVFVGSLDSKQA